MTLAISLPRALIALVSLLLIAPFAAGQVTPPPSISTSGDATVYVEPDEVIISFGIQIFNADLDTAKAENDRRGAALVKAIKALGIEARHIRTDNLIVEISYRDHVWEGIAGYLARRSYSVTVKDVKLFEKIVDAGLKNGANQLLGFDFRNSELRKYRDQARSMAAKAAREKAVALAKELDCTVGKPREISESGGWYGANYLQNAMMQNSQQQMRADGGGGDVAEALPLGQIAIRATVSVTFDLANR